MVNWRFLISSAEAARDTRQKSASSRRRKLSLSISLHLLPFSLYSYSKDSSDQDLPLAETGTKSVIAILNNTARTRTNVAPFVNLYQQATTLRKDHDVDTALDITALLYEYVESAIMVRSQRLYNARRCKKIPRAPKWRQTTPNLEMYNQMPIGKLKMQVENSEIYSSDRK